MTQGNWNSELLLFFGRDMDKLPLYEALEAFCAEGCPQLQVKVQKTQISLFARRMFARLSLRKLRGEQERCLLLSLGLPYRLSSARVFEAVEPHPGRWTNHIPLRGFEVLDEELGRWLDEAIIFAQNKR